VAVRAERLKLWEQRHELTKELTTKTFDSVGIAKSGVLPSSSNNLVPKTSTGIRDRKGIKADTNATSNWSPRSNEHLHNPLGTSNHESPKFGNSAINF
jgi:hypothetical protein